MQEYRQISGSADRDMQRKILPQVLYSAIETFKLQPNELNAQQVLNECQLVITTLLSPTYLAMQGPAKVNELEEFVRVVQIALTKTQPKEEKDREQWRKFELNRCKDLQRLLSHAKQYEKPINDFQAVDRKVRAEQFEIQTLMEKLKMYRNKNSQSS